MKFAYLGSQWKQLIYIIPPPLIQKTTVRNMYFKTTHQKVTQMQKFLSGHTENSCQKI